MGGGGQSPSPTILRQVPRVQEGGCGTGQPMPSSQALIFLTPAFTLAGGQLVQGTGSGGWYPPHGGMQLPSLGAQDPLNTPGHWLLGVQGDGRCCTWALSLKSWGSRAVPRRITPLPSDPRIPWHKR